MIIYNKLDNYLVVSADRQTFLGFEMTANLRDTSPLSFANLPSIKRYFSLFTLTFSLLQGKLVAGKS